MSDKAESVETKSRVGILRKRDTTSMVPNNSIRQRIGYHAKPKLDKKPETARSVDGGGSLFSKRNKLDPDKPITAPATAPPTPRAHGLTCGPPAPIGVNVISAGPSTTTLDSRVTATSHSSLSHKPGFIPGYIRNKTGTKNLVIAQMQSNKKQFIQIKKELTDLQNKAIEYYKRYRESITKLNKLNGENNLPVIEELQIIGFKQKSTEAILSNESTTVSKSAAPVSLSKLKQITDDKVLSNISQQVHGIQVQSFKLLQEFADRLSLIYNQMKLVDNTESGDTNQFSAKIQSLFEEIETKILEEEEQQNTRIDNFMSNLKQVMIDEQGTPVLMKDGMLDQYENYRKTTERALNEQAIKIREMENKRDVDEFANKELTKALSQAKATILELNNTLTDTKKKREERDKEFHNIVTKLKQFELLNKRIEKQLEDKVLELTSKDKSLLELKNSIKPLQEMVMKYTSEIQKLEIRLAHADEEYKNQIGRLQANYDAEMKATVALRMQINEMTLKIGEDSNTVREENTRLKNNEQVLLREIDSLKHSFNEIMFKKASNEKTNERAEDNVLKREMDRRDEEIIRLRSTVCELKEELHKRKLQVTQKNQELSDMQGVIKQLEDRGHSNEFEDEIQRLQNINKQKTREIEQLKGDYNKTEMALRLQEDSLYMQQQLLKIRGELIKSLKGNEYSTKSQISNLNAEVQKRTYAAKQFNQDMYSKTEELENLFSTLSAKNLEIKRLDHSIKMLEETNERNQQLRVKLEGKIARLETANSELKRILNYAG